MVSSSLIAPGTLLKTFTAIFWDCGHVVVSNGKEHRRNTHQEGYWIEMIPPMLLLPWGVPPSRRTSMIAFLIPSSYECAVSESRSYSLTTDTPRYKTSMRTAGMMLRPLLLSLEKSLRSYSKDGNCGGHAIAIDLSCRTNAREYTTTSQFKGSPW